MLSKILTLVSVICLIPPMATAGEKLSGPKDAIINKATVAFWKIKNAHLRCEKSEIAKKSAALLLSAAVLAHLARSAQFRNSVATSAVRTDSGPRVVEEIRSHLWPQKGYSQVPSSGFVKALKGSAFLAAIAALAESTFETQGDILSAKFIHSIFTNTAHGILGISSVGNATTSEYYTTSEDAFLDFIKDVSSENHLEYLLTSNPKLTAATLAYGKIIDSLTDSCGVLGKVDMRKIPNEGPAAR